MHKWGQQNFPSLPSLVRPRQLPGSAMKIVLLAVYFSLPYARVFQVYDSWHSKVRAIQGVRSRKPSPAPLGLVDGTGPPSCLPRPSSINTPLKHPRFIPFDDQRLPFSYGSLPMCERMFEEGIGTKITKGPSNAQPPGSKVEIVRDLGELLRRIIHLMPFGRRCCAIYHSWGRQDGLGISNVREALLWSLSPRA